MEKNIIQFINKQTCAGICCIDDQGKPYCFSCFYVFNSEEGLLYFKSSSNARHSAILLKNQWVAGTIQPDKLNVLLIKGIQFEGTVLPADHYFTKNVAGLYYKRYPAGLTVPGEIWVVQVERIKMTDSSFGFGKKIIWKRNKETAV